MPDSKHVTLAANVAQTVTLDNMYYSKVEVVNRGDTEAWVRTDGTNPAVEGEDSIVVPARSFIVLPAPDGTIGVRLLSSAAVKISVRGY